MSPRPILQLLTVTVLLTISQALAGTTEPEFIRKPGQYPLDDRGSSLTVTKQPAGSWTLKASWRFEGSESTAAPDDCLRASGWFVFLQKPGRIWIFDGVDQCLLLSNSEKQTSVSYQVMTNCPREFWNALPRKVRAKYQKVESVAPSGSPPSRSETNRTSQAAGSRH